MKNKKIIKYYKIYKINQSKIIFKIFYINKNT